MINCLLLSAGFGTRLRPITDDLAKPVVPVCAIPMMAYPLYYLEKLNLKNLCINTHYQPESVKKTIKQLSPRAENIIFYNESKEIMGNGGALLGFRDTLANDDDFILINADNVFLHENPQFLNELIEMRRSENSLASLLVTPHKEAGRTISACWTNQSNTVSGFGLEPPELHAKPHHYVGAMCVSKKVFNYIPVDRPSNILYDVLLNAMEHGETLTALNTEMSWYETGKIDDYYRAHTQLLNKWGRSQALTDIAKRFAPHLQIKNINGGMVLKHPKAQISSDVSIQDWAVVSQPINITGKSILRKCIINCSVDLNIEQDFEEAFISK